MARTPIVPKNARSVVPLSLALLIFNVLNGSEASKAPNLEPLTESSAASESDDAPKRVCS